MGRARWEIQESRRLLANPAERPVDREGFSGLRAVDLQDAVRLAVEAWCLTHLRSGGAYIEHGIHLQAFREKAPGEMVHAVNEAMSAILDRCQMAPGVSTSYVLASVRAAVEALTGAASRPPRNRRRYPAHLLRPKASRTPRKPSVRPGSWINTGRYRPAQVLEILPEPPHTMKLSYGDEIDEDFRPHIQAWGRIPDPKRVASLHDVFSAGDWFRHPRCGYGRVVEVRNSTVVVDYQGSRATVVPDPHLRRFEKVEGPEPEDTRPLARRLPAGTWIDQDHFGRGIVLGSEEGRFETLTVLFPSGAVRIAEGSVGQGPVIWKLDREPLDVTTPWFRRWVWWSRGRVKIPALACACCGYPNLGVRKNILELPRECTICGYPEFGSEFIGREIVPGVDGREDEVCVCLVGGRWWHRHMWKTRELDDHPLKGDTETRAPTRDDLAASGYSLSEARRNYESRGDMFRPGTSSPLRTKVAVSLRDSLVRLLEAAMAEPTLWNANYRLDVEQCRDRILAEVARARASR
ncbi:MAG: hypothetical protein OXH99_19820 [Bryobacterales bacterium]|nr:hypothetical protein [Bryobacterales bacterium]